MSLLDRLRGRRGWDLLRPHERAVLEAVGGELSPEGSDLLRRQVDRVEHVQRLSSGTDVSLYPPAAERGTSGPTAFPAQGPELRLATVTLHDATGTAMRARVGAVWGRVFDITFTGTPSAGLRVTGVTLHADPMDPASGRPGEAGSAMASLPPDALAEYQRLLAAGPLTTEPDSGLLPPDEVYGIDLELGPMIVVGTVGEEYVLVRTDDGAVFRAAPDDEPRAYPSIEAALSSEAESPA